MRDVCLSLYRHGFRRFAFPLGHGGNLAAMHVVAQQLIDETEGTQAMVLNWLQLAVKQYKQLLTSGKNEGHAGEGETARMLALHPELVEIGRAQIYYSEEADRAESADHPLHGGGIFKPSKSWRDVTPVGNVGNPKIATAETGEKMWDLITTWMADAIAVGFDGKPMGGS
jgi:creatinine amidohydrolase